LSLDENKQSNKQLNKTFLVLERKSVNEAVISLSLPTLPFMPLSSPNAACGGPRSQTEEEGAAVEAGSGEHQPG
jgi:hypothetical protein